MKCGCCGGGYIKISRDILGCATSRNKGTAICENRKTIKVAALEEHLLRSIQVQLMDPDLFAEFVAAFSAELNRLQAKTRSRRSQIEATIGSIERLLDKAVDAIFAGANALHINKRLVALEGEKSALQAELAGMEAEPPALLHPSMSSIYRQKIAGLASALQEGGKHSAATEAVRGLLNAVVLHPIDSGFDIDIQGDLAAILELSAAGSKTTKPSQISLEGLGGLAQQVKLVAGAGYQLWRTNLYYRKTKAS